MTVQRASVHNTTQNSSDNLTSYLQTNIISKQVCINKQESQESFMGVSLTNQFADKTFHWQLARWTQSCRRCCDLVILSSKRLVSEFSWQRNDLPANYLVSEPIVVQLLQEIVFPKKSACHHRPVSELSWVESGYLYVAPNSLFSHNGAGRWFTHAGKAESSAGDWRCSATVRGLVALVDVEVFAYNAYRIVGNHWQLAQRLPQPGFDRSL